VTTTTTETEQMENYWRSRWLRGEPVPPFSFDGYDELPPGERLENESAWCFGEPK